MKIRIENSKLIQALTVDDLRIIADALNRASDVQHTGDRARRLRDLFDDTANAMADLPIEHAP